MTGLSLDMAYIASKGEKPKTTTIPTSIDISLDFAGWQPFWLVSPRSRQSPCYEVSCQRCCCFWCQHGAIPTWPFLPRGIYWQTWLLASVIFSPSRWLCLRMQDAYKWVCLKMLGIFPTIAIFHRDNDQHNPWV